MPGCDKIGFISEAYARGELVVMSTKRRDPSRMENRFYSCGDCGLIHLTKKPRLAHPGTRTASYHQGS